MFLSLAQHINSEAIKQSDNRKRLVKVDGTIKLLSNICPHQRSRLEMTGSTITCPYHAWSFKPDGTPLGNGNTECKNRNKLEEFPVYQIGNFLFDVPVNLPYLDFLYNDNLELIEYRIDNVNAPKEVIVDLFLDVSHIPIIHKNVYDQIGIDNKLKVDWFYSNNSSLQLVYGDNDSDYALDFDKKLKYKAAWLTIYPGTMIEWQPGAVFITIAKNTNTGSKVHVFKYRDTRYTIDVWKLNEEIWETAWSQDACQSELIDGINTLNLEESKQHYVDWCNRESTKT
jgi:phenylpropionate dioxygenase-like ring-hydroxylating dioxygenase large terminal subunit